MNLLPRPLELPTAMAAARRSLRLDRLAGLALRRDVLLTVVGLVGLWWWATTWKQNLRHHKYVAYTTSWFTPFGFVGLDFLHNYYAANHWLAGGDPFHEPFGDPLGRKLCYPPAVLPAFAWCKFVSAPTAVKIWTWSVGAFAVIGTVAACRARNKLGLTPVPVVFAAAAVLLSHPVAFAMERGNYDLIIVPLLVGAAAALQKRTLNRDIVAGVLLGLAVCFKVYPGLAVLGLIPLRRTRAGVFAGLTVGACLLFQPHNLPVMAANLKDLVKFNNPGAWSGMLSPTGHSLTIAWKYIWIGTKLSFLSKVPYWAAAAAIFGPLLLVVAHRVYRNPAPGRLVLPYLLWVVAVATFIPKVSNDYNLIFVLLSALAVWDRRDPVPAQVGLAFMLLWAQPLAFPIGPSMFLGMKVGAVVAVGVCLAARAKEQLQAAPSEPPAAAGGA